MLWAAACGVEGRHPKSWVKPVAARFLMGVGQNGCGVWIGPSGSSLKNMGNEDPSSSTASCPSPGKCAPCQPSLLPSSALPSPGTAWRGSSGDGSIPGRVSLVLRAAGAHVLPSLQTIPISQHIRAASAVTSGLSSCPWRPKASCTLPQLCRSDFQLLPREGILLMLALEETAALFSTLCSLQSCRFAGVSELGLSDSGHLPQALDPAGAAPGAGGAGRVRSPG